MEDDVSEILKALSHLIMVQLRGASSRQYFPTHDAYGDDDAIRQGKERAAALRKMREEFENLASGIL